jgi:hypothetical protein
MYTVFTSLFPLDIIFPHAIYFVLWKCFCCEWKCFFFGIRTKVSGVGCSKSYCVAAMEMRSPLARWIKFTSETNTQVKLGGRCTLTLQTLCSCPLQSMNLLLSFLGYYVTFQNRFVWGFIAVTFHMEVLTELSFEWLFVFAHNKDITL